MLPPGSRHVGLYNLRTFLPFFLLEAFHLPSIQPTVIGKFPAERPMATQERGPARFRGLLKLHKLKLQWQQIQERVDVRIDEVDGALDEFVMTGRSSRGVTEQGLGGYSRSLELRMLTGGRSRAQARGG